MDLALTCDDVQLVPQRSIVSSRASVELRPFIYSAPMDRVTGYELTRVMLEAGEYPVLSRFLDKEEWVDTVKEFADHPNFWLAVSGKPGEFLDTMLTLSDLAIKPANYAIDIAVGDSVIAEQMAGHLVFCLAQKIMSGSIASPAGALRAKAAGCTHLRVGIGPGSMCTTRRVTGFGIPQWSAVREISRCLGSEPGVEIIADGGIRSTGDAVKLLGAGATGIMLGSEFARALESPGWEEEQILLPENARVFVPGRNQFRLTKSFRGQASGEFQAEHGVSSAAPEGAATIISWDGETVDSIVARYRAATRSACSYGGVDKLKDFSPVTQTFIRVTPAGVTESHAHGVTNG